MTSVDRTSEVKEAGTEQADREITEKRKIEELFIDKGRGQGAGWLKRREKGR